MKRVLIALLFIAAMLVSSSPFLMAQGRPPDQYPAPFPPYGSPMPYPPSDPWNHNAVACLGAVSRLIPATPPAVFFHT